MVGRSFRHPQDFLPPKTCSPTTRLLYQPDHQIKSFTAGLLRALSQLKHAGASWKKLLLTTGSLFQEAPWRQRFLRNVSWLAARQAVYTAIHKTLAGHLLLTSPGRIDLNPQRTGTCQQEAYCTGPRIAGMGSPVPGSSLRSHRH